MRKIVIVLGMHRSATSMTTELLSSYGLYVGEKEDLCKANQSNQRGFFENRCAVLLNDKILYEHGMHWAELQENINKVRKTKYSFEINEVLNSMQKKAGDGQILLLKDPRMCLTEPVWRKQMVMLDIEEQMVMVFRHPYEVAKSLVIRDNMNFAYALKLWFYNNYSALCSMATCDEPVIVLNHNNYFTAYDRQIKKIENFLNWTGVNNDLDSIIDVSLRHNNVNEIKEEVSLELKVMVSELYQYLIELSLMKKVNINKKKLDQFSGYLKKMVVTAYTPNDDDLPPKVFRNSLGKEKKKWCAYQLENNISLLVHGFQQMRQKKEITELSIYGNGTLAKSLLPVLDLAGIDVTVIYDKNPVNTGQKIKVMGIHEIDFIEKVVLNTAVNYGVQVQNELTERFGNCKVLDLYKLMYEIIKGELVKSPYESH